MVHCEAASTSYVLMNAAWYMNQESSQVEKSDLKQDPVFVKGHRGTNPQARIITEELHLLVDGVAILCLSLALSGMARYILML